MRLTFSTQRNFHMSALGKEEDIACVCQFAGAIDSLAIRDIPRGSDDNAFQAWFPPPGIESGLKSFHSKSFHTETAGPSSMVEEISLENKLRFLRACLQSSE
jgi:hypothetical protein